MVRTTQADAAQPPHDTLQLQPLGQTHQPSRPVPPSVAHFGEGLRRLPDKLRNLGAHDFEISSPLYSGRRVGQSFVTPNSEADDMAPLLAPPAVASDQVESAATSSRRTDSDMGRVIDAFARSDAAVVTQAAHAAHSMAKTALSTESACIAEIVRQFAGRAAPDRNGATGSTMDGRTLARRIVTLFAATPASASTASASPTHESCSYADALACADSLAAATHADIALANAVLDRLERGLDLRAPGGAHHSQSSLAPNDEPAAIEHAAWRTAQLMASTTSGYEALRRVAGASWPQAEGVRHAPRVVLRAGAALVRSGNADASPAGILRLARQWRNDPAADHVQRHVSAMALAAAKLWRHGDLSALTPAEIGVVFAGRHNYMTDGPGTPLAKVKSRLFKTIDKSIPRAGDSRWKSALPRVIGKQKTAFAILDKGIRSAHLDLVEKERSALRPSLENALESLSAQRGADGSDSDPTRSLAAIVARMSQTGGDAVSVLVERAELTRWVSRSTHAYGNELDNHDYQAIAADVRSAFARLPMPSASAPPAHRLAWMALYRFAATLRRTEDRGDDKAWEPLRQHMINRSAVLDIDKLEEMAKRWPQAQAAAPQDWKTMTRIARANPIKPQDLTPEGIKDALDELAGTMKSGGKVVLVDGGQVGFSTAGLSANLGKLLHAGGIVVSPRLNLRVRGGRQAFVEYGRRTACFSFSAGSQNRVSFDAGAGIQVGGDYLIVRAGVTLNVVAYQTDRLNRHAFSLIVARRMKADGSGFDDARLQRGMRAVNAFLFDHARDRDLADGEQAWQALAQTFLENDDFSVVWNEQGQQERRHGVNVSGGVSVKASIGETSARLGPQFGYAYDYASRNVADSEDTGGTTAIESHRSGRGGRHIASAGLSTSLGNSPSATEEVASFGLLSSDFPMVRYRIRDRQHVAKMSLVREEGRLVHRVSYADTEFAHYDDYAHALRNDERWALMFGIDPNHPAIPGGADREAILARGKQRVEMHLAQVKRNHKDNQLLFYRFRLREHAAKLLDAYAERAAMLRALGGAADEIARWEQDYAEVLARPDSWLPVEFKGYERVVRQSSPGLNFGVRLTHDQSITGERELVSMIHSAPQLDAIDRIWPRE
jgi:hypothetical protein